MVFSKAFPRYVKNSNYPRWEEVELSAEEEKEQERKCRIENIKIMMQCIEDAKRIIDKKELKKFQGTLSDIAIALFEKRASHSVFFKENKSKEKFDKLFKK